jgi:hypothetical protein
LREASSGGSASTVPFSGPTLCSSLADATASSRFVELVVHNGRIVLACPHPGFTPLAFRARVTLRATARNLIRDRVEPAVVVCRGYGTPRSDRQHEALASPAVDSVFRSR